MVSDLRLQYNNVEHITYVPSAKIKRSEAEIHLIRLGSKDDGLNLGDNYSFTLDGWAVCEEKYSGVYTIVKSSTGRVHVQLNNGHLQASSMLSSPRSHTPKPEFTITATEKVSIGTWFHFAIV